jgi:uncharacterized protein YjbI with pentapeptide repeats
VFTAATLTGADLRDTRWDQVNLTHANLQAARLNEPYCTRPQSSKEACATPSSPVRFFTTATWTAQT